MGKKSAGLWKALAAVAAILCCVTPVYAQNDLIMGTSLEAPEMRGAAPSTSPTNQTPDGKKRLAVNPVTGQTTALENNYTPLTARERWKLYYEQSFWSVGAYFGPLFVALVLDQATGQPKQWGGGFEGYGRRVASRVGTGDIAQNGFQFPVAALLHEDVRYIGAGEPAFGGRLRHAIIYSFLTYNSQGHPTPNLANIGGYYFAAGISTRWLPGIRNPWSYTLSNGTEALGIGVGINIIQEFWPEITRAILHRR